MALWGISTTTETAENNYGIPKFLKEVDRNHTPHNCFASNRGWIYRNYKDGRFSGLSTAYSDEVLVPVAGLNTTGIGSNTTGLGLATQVAVFFADPNNSSIISIGGGATTGITTGSRGEVHLVFNEVVYAGAGSTVLINTFGPLGGAAQGSIVATAASTGVPVQANVPGIGQTMIRFNGQVTNRVAFAFTAPSTVFSANVNFRTTTVSSTVALGSTTIFVTNSTGVSVGSSVSVGAAITNVSVTGIGTTSITIGTGSTIASAISAGVAVTFSTLTRRTFLGISTTRTFTGIVTDSSGGVGVSSAYTPDSLRNVAGAGKTTGDDGTGTNLLFVVP